MVDHDDRGDGDPDPDAPMSGTPDPEGAEPAGPRRSTFTPPPAQGVDGQAMSDDDLADALFQDFEKATHSGTIHVIPEVPPWGTPDRDDPFEGALAEALEDTDVRESPLIAVDEPDDVADPVDEGIVPGGVVEPGTVEAPPQRPIRRSLLAAEVASVIDGEAPSTLDALERLEEQLRLREEDAREFAEWQESMLASGSPAAAAEVASARSEFQDILEPPPVSDSPPEPPSHPTHTFRSDEVLDSDLLKAPAPMTAPVSDIPPPPGHELMPPAPQPRAPAASATPPIPELVEPAAPPTGPPVVFTFDTLVHGVPADATADATYQDESDFRDEDVGDTDQALSDLLGPFPVTSEGVAIIPDAPVAPIEPLATPRIPTSEHVILEEEPTSPPAFRVEESAVGPTPTDQRVGRAARVFWLWFAANSSVVSVAFGAAIFSLGMSLRQAIVATLAGIALSFLPLGLGTLAGKWSGQPTMIVSRASFGHFGNILPAVLALVVRLFWGAVLLWFLAAGTARILFGADLGGGLTEPQLTIVGLAVGFLLALVIAFFGYGLIARFQLGVTVISAVLIAGLLAITWPAVDIANALTIGDGPWILVVTGAVLVFSFVGLVWAVSSADLARYQRPGGSGAASMLSSTFGATIPAFVLIAYGAVLAASNPDVAAGLLESPLDAIALLIPTWYPVPLIAALALSLLSGVVISIYSGGFALQATGVTMRRSASVVIVGVALAAVAILLAVSVGDFSLILRDVATSLAVPVAAWAGIFAAEMMIRNRRFDATSLLNRGGVYPDFAWTNLSALVLASAIGFGLTTASVGWLSWQGYLFPLLDVPGASDLAGSDLGVLVALILGLLVPIIGGIPAIRRQEEPSALRTRSTQD